MEHQRVEPVLLGIVCRTCQVSLSAAVLSRCCLPWWLSMKFPG